MDTSQSRPPKIGAIANNKGGVMKTTATCFVGSGVAMKGTRTLLLDMDPQCNLSTMLLDMDTEGNDWIPPVHPEDGERYDVSKIFNSADVNPYPTNIEGLDIIPCRADNTYLDHANDDAIQVFVNFLHQPMVWENYGLILIDTPPAKGALTTAAIRASTHCLIPVVPEQKSVEGLLGMLDLIKTENRNKRGSKKTKLLGILPSKCDYRYRSHAMIEAGLRANPVLGPLTYGQELKDTIRERPTIKEMDLKGASPTTPFGLKENSDCRKEWERLTQFVMTGMEIGV